MQMKKSADAKPQEVGDGPWFLKKSDEDGIFVKQNGTRMLSSNGQLLGKILNVSVQPKSRGGDSILVTCENLAAVMGQTCLLLKLNSFDPNGSTFSEAFEGLKTAEEFVEAYRKCSDGDDQLKQTPICETPRSTKTQLKPVGLGKKKHSGTSMETLAELISPPKKQRGKSFDDDIAMHHLGKFKLKLDMLSDCPDHWLDRPVDTDAVQNLIEKIKEHSSLQTETQSWLAVTNFSKLDLAAGQTVKDLLNGSDIRVIGGRHRHAAYKKLTEKKKDAIDPSLSARLDKVWVSVYDDKLTDEQIKRLAYMHNCIDEGSRITPWIDRVKTCRAWAYRLAKRDLDEPTPDTSSEWRKSCHRMFVSSEKDVASLEPTLQAALLAKPVWEKFVEVADLYKKSKLKDMVENKPSRRRSMDIKQTQIGMPLQGLDQQSKLNLLGQLVEKKISLKTFVGMAASIKNKKKIAEAFMQYSGTQSWEELQRRFPRHATEEKLSQFSKLKIKGKAIPMELANFFQRAMEVESQSNTEELLRLNVEGEKGVHFFKCPENESVGVMLPGDFCSLNPSLIRRAIPNFKGFSLSIVSLNVDVDVISLKMFLSTLHSLNVNMDCYNVIFQLPNSEEIHKVKSQMEKMSVTQLAYFAADVNPKAKTPTARLQNVVSPLVIGQWSRYGEPMEGNLIGANHSNLFTAENGLDKMVNVFTFEGSWVLDLSSIFE
ncbi:uncharacterized protein LOC114575537, partial [Exaiptasia diaphana]|uniref:Uncharacterized protein n=1 Tax=Exaiptasia diaphana TaxID=2652724 RepID=A0A913YQF0_EXADI